MRTPEEESVPHAAPPPKDCGRKGLHWRLTRKLSGRRGGSRDFAERLAPLLISRGCRRRGMVEPCLSTHGVLNLVYAIHAHDPLASGPAVHHQQMLSSIGEEMLLKFGEPLTKEGEIPERFSSASVLGRATWCCAEYRRDMSSGPPRC